VQARLPPRLAIRYSLWFLCLLCAGPAAIAETSITQGAPTIAPRGQAGSPDKNATTQPPLGCSRANWLAGKCSTHPSTAPDYPPNQPRPPYPDRDPYRRPVIIQSAPAPVQEAPLTDDWEGCRNAKLSQLNSQQNGDQSRARQLDEWLWKNCRSYSEDLRQLEQDRM
jgi:hypothetical protein